MIRFPGQHVTKDNTTVIHYKTLRGHDKVNSCLSAQYQSPVAVEDASTRISPCVTGSDCFICSTTG